MKKLSVEFLLGTLLLPWMVVLTYGMFNSDKAQAVQETKYDAIIQKLDEIKHRLDKKGF